MNNNDYLQVINHLIYHVTYLYDSCMIDENVRIEYMTKINNAICKINNEHKMDKPNQPNQPTQQNKPSKLSKTNNPIQLIKSDKLSKLNKLDSLDRLDSSETLDDVNEQTVFEIIQNIIISIGTCSIRDICKIWRCDTSKTFESHELIDILDLIFIPVAVECVNESDYVFGSVIECSTEIPNGIIVIPHICDSVEQDTCDNSDEKSGCECEYDGVELCKCNNTKLCNLQIIDDYYVVSVNDVNIKGIFRYDCVNSLTKIPNPLWKYIVDKKEHIQTIIDEHDDTQIIPHEFKKKYIEKITIGELLTITDDNVFVKKIVNRFNTYITYLAMSFRELFDSFMQSDLKQKHYIITCLLMGDTEKGDSNAGLLFGVLKDNTHIVHNIISRHCTIEEQIKLTTRYNYVAEELNKISSLNNTTDTDIKKQVITNHYIPNEIKKIVLEKINEMKMNNIEYSKHHQFVKIIANYPWNCGEDIFASAVTPTRRLCKIHSILEKTLNDLNEIVYGHNECKNTIINLLGKWLCNPMSMGKAIGLLGPLGVGKTLIARALGKTLGIPFTQINLGGVNDSAVLIGHSITYSGSVPGLIVKRMVESGKSRCIMFFDELDKTGTKFGTNEIHDTLIHVIDPLTNKEFNDNFFQDINFPIDKVLFIFAFNDITKIDKVLLDRMEVIEVKPFSVDDKISIVKDYMFKDILCDTGMVDGSISIKTDVINYIINNFTHEAGVRDLKRNIEKIILKLNKDRITQMDDTEPISITTKIVDMCLHRNNFNTRKIQPTSEVGIVNAIYTTSHGVGGILPIAIYKNVIGEKFELKFTGQQRDIMRESMLFAFTVASNMIRKTIFKKFLSLNPYGLHVHTPDISIPKDGTSSSVACVVAFMSVFTNKKIKNNIAITGDIDLNGYIKGISGLEAKIFGCKYAGVRVVFIPEENKSELVQIAKNNIILNDTFNCVCVANIRDILDRVLIDFKCSECLEV